MDHTLGNVLSTVFSIFFSYIDEELNDKKPLIVSGMKIILNEQSLRVSINGDMHIYYLLVIVYRFAHCLDKSL